MQTDKADKKKDEMKEMGFLDHLEELRWRLLKILFSVILFTILCFIVSDFFVELLLKPSKMFQPDMKIQVLKVQGMLMLKFGVALVMGIVFSIPVIAYQFWAFIAPGLYRDEKKWGPLLVISVSLFFLAGVAFAYFILAPFAIKFLSAIGSPDVEKNISINYYAKFVLQLLMASGLIFQMPVASFILTKMGLITPVFLRKSWRYAIIIILILAAFITPPDPVSMILMGVPLFFLYEFSIVVSRVASGKEKIDSDQEQLEG
ncbi:twin-arginine translocase subunit TatC [bacterium]|nr:twin-arginine translocase subunit TatC [bacterium]MBU1065874.1 twin-arginine translocase subunit TatC [bacterium]MBU1634197.1 twin-arginine translocase subunit TatC [bacterium]MBU1872816.1 twin-arginine translocase subunit TatC [bacterium]